MSTMVGATVSYWGSLYGLHGTTWTVDRQCCCEECAPDEGYILPPETRYVLIGQHGRLEHVGAGSIINESRGIQ